MPQRDLLARRLGVEIDENRHVFRDFVQYPVHRLERTIHGGLHEDPPLHVHDGEPPGRKRHEAPAPPRTFRGEVRRPHEIHAAVYLPGELLLPPRMVAQREGVHAVLEEFVRERRGDARSRGTVFHIGDHRIQVQLGPQTRHFALEDPPSRRPHDISYHQNSHCVTYYTIFNRAPIPLLATPVGRTRRAPG